MPVDKAEIEGLVERLRQATGQDRELDRDILALFECVDGGDDPIIGWCEWNRLGNKTYVHPAPLSDSIDAALALVERLLPGWRYDIHSPRFGIPFEAVLMDGDSASRRIVVGNAATAPLAILSALLTALGSSK